MDRNNGQSTTTTSSAIRAITRLFDSIPTLVAYVDSRERYQYANRAVREWLDLPEHKIIGKRVQEVLGLEAYHTVQPYISKALAGEGTRFQFAHQNHLGKRWVDVCYSPDLDDHRKVQGYTVQITDITSTKKVEDELRDYIENAPIGSHWVDEHGIILWANQAELDIVGYTKDEYIGRPISDFHADPGACREILSKLAHNESLHHYEAVLKRKDGGLRHVLLSANVLWQGDKFVHTRCFTLDVTEKKKRS